MNSLVFFENTQIEIDVMPQEQFANPQSIKDHHCGANTLLAHYHWARRNMAPFILALTPDGLKIVREAAALTPDQAQFAHATAIWIKQESSYIICPIQELHLTRTKQDLAWTMLGETCSLETTSSGYHSSMIPPGNLVPPSSSEFCWR